MLSGALDICIRRRAWAIRGGGFANSARGATAHEIAHPWLLTPCQHILRAAAASASSPLSIPEPDQRDFGRHLIRTRGGTRHRQGVVGMHPAAAGAPGPGPPPLEHLGGGGGPEASGGAIRKRGPGVETHQGVEKG